MCRRRRWRRSKSAFLTACQTVGFFLDEATGTWRVEGVKPIGVNEADLAAGLALASAVTGVTPALHRAATEAGGWLARVYEAFPELWLAGASPCGGRMLTDRLRRTGSR